MYDKQNHHSRHIYFIRNSIKFKLCQNSFSSSSFFSNRIILRKRNFFTILVFIENIQWKKTYIKFNYSIKRQTFWSKNYNSRWYVSKYVKVPYVNDVLNVLKCINHRVKRENYTNTLLNSLL